VNPALGGFVEKWLQAEPEGRLVAHFAPEPLRGLHGALSALVFELEDAALRIAEPAVAEAKLAWWQDELGRAERGQPRHPLTQDLAQRVVGAPFSRLGAALPRLHHFESADGAALDALLAPWAHALAALSSALSASPEHAWSEALLRQLFLVRRLRELQAQLRLGRLWLPLDLMAAEGLARHQLSAGTDGTAPAQARRAQARRLLACPWPDAGAHRLLSMQVALARLRLQRMSRQGQDELPPLRALWRTWRAARA
jgi:15-cis-phytoene synthase